MALWDKLTGTPSTGAACIGIDFSPDESLMAVALDNFGSGGPDPIVRVYNTSDWSEVSVGAPDGRAISCKFSNDGTKLAVGYRTSPYIKVYNVSDWSEVTITGTIGGAPNNFSWKSDDSQLAVTPNSGTKFYVYETSGWTHVSGTPSFATQPAPPWAVFSPDDSEIALALFNSPYGSVYETTTWTKVDDVATDANTQQTECLFTNDGSQLAFCTVGGQFWSIVNTSDYTTLVDTVEHQSTYSFTKTNASDLYVAGVQVTITPGTDDVLIVDPTNSWADVTTFDLGFTAGQGRKIVFSSNDNYLAVSRAGVTSPFLEIYEGPGVQSGGDFLSTTAATSTVTSNLNVARSMASVPAATSTVSGYLSGPVRYVSSTAVTSTVGPANLSGPIRYVSSTTVASTVTPAIIINATFISTTAVTSVLGPTPTIEIAREAISTTTAASTVSSTFDRQPKFATTVAATSTVTSAFKGPFRFASTLAVTSNVAATLAVGGPPRPVKRLASPAERTNTSTTGDFSFSYTVPAGTDRCVIAMVQSFHTIQPTGSAVAHDGATLNGTAATGTVVQSQRSDDGNGFSDGTLDIYYWLESDIASGTLVFSDSGNTTFDGRSAIIVTYANVISAPTISNVVASTGVPAITVTSSTIGQENLLVQGLAVTGGFAGSLPPTWTAATDSPAHVADASTTSGSKDTQIMITDSTDTASGAADNDLASFYASNDNWDVRATSISVNEQVSFLLTVPGESLWLATVAATSNVTAEFKNITPKFASTTTATATASGRFNLNLQLFGSTAVTSVLGPTPNLDRQPVFVSTTTAASLVTASYQTGGIFASDTIVVTSTASATLDRQPKFSTTIAATSTVSGEFRNTTPQFLSTTAATSVIVEAALSNGRPFIAAKQTSTEETPVTQFNVPLPTHRAGQMLVVFIAHGDNIGSSWDTVGSTANWRNERVISLANTDTGIQVNYKVAESDSEVIIAETNGPEKYYAVAYAIDDADQYLVRSHNQGLFSTTQNPEFRSLTMDYQRNILGFAAVGGEKDSIMTTAPTGYTIDTTIQGGTGTNDGSLSVATIETNTTTAAPSTATMQNDTAHCTFNFIVYKRGPNETTFRKRFSFNDSTSSFDTNGQDPRIIDNDWASLSTNDTINVNNWFYAADGPSGSDWFDDAFAIVETLFGAASSRFLENDTTFQELGMNAGDAILGFDVSSIWYEHEQVDSGMTARTGTSTNGTVEIVTPYETVELIPSTALTGAIAPWAELTGSAVNLTTPILATDSVQIRIYAETSGTSAESGHRIGFEDFELNAITVTASNEAKLFETGSVPALFGDWTLATGSGTIGSPLQVVVDVPTDPSYLNRPNKGLLISSQGNKAVSTFRIDNSIIPNDTTEYCGLFSWDQITANQTNGQISLENYSLNASDELGVAYVWVYEAISLSRVESEVNVTPLTVLSGDTTNPVEPFNEFGMFIVNYLATDSIPINGLGNYTPSTGLTERTSNTYFRDADGAERQHVVFDSAVNTSPRTPEGLVRDSYSITVDDVSGLTSNRANWIVLNPGATGLYVSSSATASLDSGRTFSASVSATSSVSPSTFNRIPVTETVITTPTTTHSITLPEHEIGDLVFVIFAAGTTDNNTTCELTSVTAGWDYYESARAQGTISLEDVTVSLISKVATSTSETLDVVTRGSVKSVSHSYRMQGVSDYQAIFTNGATSGRELDMERTLPYKVIVVGATGDSYDFSSTPNGYLDPIVTDNLPSLATAHNNQTTDVIPVAVWGAPGTAGERQGVHIAFFEPQNFERIRYEWPRKAGVLDQQGWVYNVQNGTTPDLDTANGGVDNSLNSFAFIHNNTSGEGYIEITINPETDLGLTSLQKIAGYSNISIDVSSSISNTQGSGKLANGSGSNAVEIIDTVTRGVIANQAAGQSIVKVTGADVTGLLQDHTQDITIRIYVDITSTAAVDKFVRIDNFKFDLEFTTQKLMATVVAGNSNVAAALDRQPTYDTTIGAVSTVASNFERNREYLSTVIAQSALVQPTTFDLQLSYASTTNVVATPVSNIDVTRPLSSITAAALTVNPNEFFYGYESVITATSTVTADLEIIRPLMSATVSQSAVVGPTRLQRAVDWNSVTSVASAITLGNMLVDRPFRADFNGFSVTTAIMDLKGRIFAQVFATSTVSATLERVRDLEAPIAITSNVNGNIVEGLRFLTGIIAQSAVVLPTNLEVARTLASQIDAVSLLTVQDFQRDIEWATQLDVTSTVLGTVVVITNTLELTFFETYLYEPEPCVLRFKTDTFDSTVTVNEILPPVELQDNDELDPMIIDSDHDC